MSEDHDALALPLGIQHVGKVGAACTQNAAMGPEGLPVHHKEHIAVDALVQKPGEMRRGAGEERTGGRGLRGVPLLRLTAPVPRIIL